jgi:hypothetical protein
MSSRRFRKDRLTAERYSLRLPVCRFPGRRIAPDPARTQSARIDLARFDDWRGLIFSAIAERIGFIRADRPLVQSSS